MGKIQAGFIVDLSTFKLFVGNQLGSFYDRAEKIFLAIKGKEDILSYSIAIILIRATEIGNTEAVLAALEQAAPSFKSFNGDYRKTPNERLINEIVERFKLI